MYCLDEAADARDFSDAFRLGDAITNIPVLQRAQIGEETCFGLQRILVDPADAGRVPVPKVGVTPGGNLRAAALRYSRTRRRAPVDIGAILGKMSRRRKPRKMKSLAPLRFRHRQASLSVSGIGDLILDHLWRLTAHIRYKTIT